MTKNLLCTISEDPHMFNGLRFLCRFFENKERFRLTLLSMAAPDSEYCRFQTQETPDANSNTAPNPDKNLCMAQTEALRTLHWDGFNPEQIRVKSCTSPLCRIEDIEGEMEEETYSAVLMGRRGLNRLMDFTQKCLSHKLFERHPETPLLLCRKPDLNRKNVLLCVDGSESAYAMSRFVASMLIGEPHLVTLCRIINDNAAERHASTEIFNRCEEIMSKEGFNLSQLRYMIYPSHSAKNAILDNATWGKFAVVATGTTDKNPIKRLLYGSTTNFLISELSGSVLWVHP